MCPQVGDGSPGRVTSCTQKDAQRFSEPCLLQTGLQGVENALLLQA